MSDPITHYILPLTEVNGRDQLSACNRWVRESEHSTEPTCPECRAYLLEDSRELTAEDMFGTLDRSTLVEPSYGKNADRHYNSYTERRR